MTDAALDLTKKTLRSKDRANMWLGVGLIISLFFNGVTLFQNTNDARHNRDLIDDINASRQARNVSICIQTNVQIEGTRNALIGGADGLLSISTQFTPEQIRTIHDTYAAAVEAELPYRDCSPDGIAKYLEDPPADPAVK